MKTYKFILLFLATASCSLLVADDAGQETDFERQLNETDVNPIRQFVESKENISLEDKDQNMEISGDVRFEYRNIHESANVIKVDQEDGRFFQRYESLRGGDAMSRGLPVSNNDFDVEFNFKIKYTYGRSWFGAHVQYDNSAGIKGHNDCITTRPECQYIVERDSRRGCKGSGEGNNVNLKRAYMGYNIYADGVHRWDIELGRRKLNDIFDSEIQFSNRFDGAILKYASSIDKVADWYFYAGAFVVDERVNRFGSAFEVGFLNVFDTGLDLKYSLINWLGNGRSRCGKHFDPIGYNFKNSQFTFDYHFTAPYTCELPAEFYGAFLINHAARKRCVTHNKLANLGWYLGLYLGEVEDAGDWSMDILYEWVQAQAVADCDVDGICHGNIQDEQFTDVYELKDKVTGDVVDVLIPGRGNANYKGWKFEFLYGITDNLSLDLLYQFSHPVNSHIGGAHAFKEFKCEAIYAF